MNVFGRKPAGTNRLRKPKVVTEARNLKRSDSPVSVVESLAKLTKKPRSKSKRQQVLRALKSLLLNERKLSPKRAIKLANDVKSVLGLDVGKHNQVLEKLRHAIPESEYSRAEDLVMTLVSYEESPALANLDAIRTSKIEKFSTAVVELSAEMKTLIGSLPDDEVLVDSAKDPESDLIQAKVLKSEVKSVLKKFDALKSRIEKSFASSNTGIVEKNFWHQLSNTGVISPEKAAQRFFADMTDYLSAQGPSSDTSRLAVSVLQQFKHSTGEFKSTVRSIVRTIPEKPAVHLELLAARKVITGKRSADNFAKMEILELEGQPGVDLDIHKEAKDRGIVAYGHYGETATIAKDYLTFMTMALDRFETFDPVLDCMGELGYAYESAKSSLDHLRPLLNTTT